MNNKLLVIGGAVLGMASQAALAGILGSKHDLSANTNPYGAYANATNEICVFCHTPHSANNDLNNNGTEDHLEAGARAPLWNRSLSDVGVFTPYQSPTMNATCADTPNPVSLACLSCHDSVQNNSPGSDKGAVFGADVHDIVNPSNSGKSQIPANTAPNCNGCHNTTTGGGLDNGGNGVIGLENYWWQIGPDLSNDHPISLIYNDAATADPYFNTAEYVTSNGLRLLNGRVECPSCHNPHDPTNEPFLRRTIDGSTLCLTCHNK